MVRVPLDVHRLEYSRLQRAVSCELALDTSMQPEESRTSIAHEIVRKTKKEMRLVQTPPIVIKKKVGGGATRDGCFVFSAATAASASVVWGCCRAGYHVGGVASSPSLPPCCRGKKLSRQGSCPRRRQCTRRRPAQQ